MSRPPALHRALLAGVRAFNRNPWTSNRLELVPREADSFYADHEGTPFFEDGLWTNHGHGFTDEERYRRAYARAVQAVGGDYQIHWRAHTVLWAAESAARVPGAFVECGTGRGFMASAICEYLGWSDRPFYLYDTFEPRLGTGAALNAAYVNGPEPVRKNFAQWAGVQLVVGRIPDSLAAQPDQVAFLHVDLNVAESEEQAVRHFWPRLSVGGILVYDDYGSARYASSRRTADDLSRELGFAIFCSPTGQGVVVKAPRA